MIRNNKAEYLISVSDIEEIVKNMKKLPYCKAIMTDNILRRRLYQVKNSQENKDQITWVRILEGDIDCDGKPKCTITYKDKDKDMSKESEAKLKVENFDDANHLFSLLNFKCTSYQENRRSKFVCKLDHVKYILIFDVWPQIEDLVFVSVNVMSSASKESIRDFVDMLELEKYNKCTNKRVDVDEIYLERFKKAASFIPNITFDFDLDLS